MIIVTSEARYIDAVSNPDFFDKAVKKNSIIQL